VLTGAVNVDFGLKEEQEMLKTTARNFLEKECPISLVRDMEEDEKGYSPELWHKIAELGWLGLVFPEKYGGGGGDFLDLTVLLEEMGRSLVPGPFVPTVVLCGLPILAAGTEEQKHDFLPQIAAGKAILTMALTEPSACYSAQGIEAGALPDNSDYIINGTKLFVPDAHIAQYFLCVVRTGGGDINLLLIDARSQGIRYTLLKTLASDRQCEVIFNQVRVPQKNTLGKRGEGWALVEETLRQAAVAECALMLGGAQRVSEMTVDYVKERVQYDRPIGSFQVIQHKCADMAIDIEGARYITYQAAWKLSQGLPCAREVSMAKAWVGEAANRTCLQACHLHGAIGYTQDHDVQLYLRRIKAAGLIFGDTVFHHEIVAQHLGL
jgi:alkylation response protein AidB-like acyl-CoA dehydrogenase